MVMKLLFLFTLKLLIRIRATTTEVDRADVESELSLDILIDKNFKLSIDAVALPNSYSLATVVKSQTLFVPHIREDIPDKPTTLLPPSRAPPAIA